MAKPTAPTESQVNALLRRAQTGDSQAIAEARAFLDEDPKHWDGIGHLAAMAMSAWIGAAVGEKHVIAQDAVRRHLAKLRDDLVGGRELDPLERLLINRVQLTWLQLHSAEIVYAQQIAQGVSLTLQQHYEFRLNMAQRRHLAAIRTLATVRRLLVPATPTVYVEKAAQVNVAEQQMNAAGPLVRMDEYRRTPGGA